MRIDAGRLRRKNCAQMRKNAEVGFGVDFGLASGLLRACSGCKNCAQIMHTTRQFLYSKGKIHTSYFRLWLLYLGRTAGTSVHKVVSMNRLGVGYDFR